MGAQLPDPADISKLLRSLLGCTIEFRQASDASPTWKAGFSSLCLDDAGNPVAAFATNARAGAFMGGKLMMLPDGPLEDAADSGELDEVLVDALSEVFNNLTVPFNAIANNPHVASKPAAPTDAVRSEADWLDKPSQTLELTADVLGGDGRLVVLIK
ncbi:MAG: hypothetical protein KDC95_16970 [Planctomycetes bacterium]|nr:hypothetical protein [Planctomycetota bacterium]